MLSIVVSNKQVPDDPLAGLDYMLPEERERVFAAADIEYKAGSSLQEYMRAKCEFAELRRKKRMVEEIMDITGAATEAEAVGIIKKWVESRDARESRSDD